MKRIIRGLLVAIVLVTSGITLTGCGSCTEGQTRSRGVGRDAVHEKCYKKIGDTAPHWYQDKKKPARP
jgi:hypothetical protein